jgi:hypothetical protein
MAGRRVLSNESLAWFDENYAAGVEADKLIVGLQMRGHDVGKDEVKWLARRRGLSRPLNFHGIRGDGYTYEQVVQRSLLWDKPRVVEIDKVDKDGPRFHYPGGFSMIGGTTRASVKGSEGPKDRPRKASLRGLPARGSA